MTFAKRVFLIAGIYGLIVLLPLYFLEQRIGLDTPPPITHPEFFYGFVGTAVAFQLVFLILAGDPVHYRPMMLASVVEKAAFGIPVALLFLQGRAPGMMLVFGTIDLLFGALFIVAYARTARPGTSPT